MVQRSVRAWRVLLAIAGSGVVVPAAFAQRSAVPPDSSLFAAREAVWHAYFAASPDLAATLPEDFIAVNEGDSLWMGRTATLAAAKESAAGGTRLVALKFPRNVVQRYGNTAIIHSRYEAVMQRAGSSWTMQGRISEVFVWDGKRWIHPTWHMDIESR